MRLNGRAIYGTTASPFTKLAWGRCTKAVTGTNGTLYLHVFEWPKDGTLVVPGLKNRVRNVRALASGKELPFSADGATVMVSVPSQPIDSCVSVIALDFDGPLNVEQILPAADAEGRLNLHAREADIHNSLNAHAKLEGKGNEAHIADWKHPEGWLSWDFQCSVTGTFRITAELLNAEGGKVNLLLDDHARTVEFPVSSAKQSVDLGTVVMKTPGLHTVALKPVQKEWRGAELVQLKLAPVAP
jgi:alpha-L-fucosidase